MAIDQAAPRTRRSVLALGLGGLGGAIAAALGRPTAALAHDPDDVQLGEINSAAATTTVQNISTDAPSLVGSHSGQGAGLVGRNITTDAAATTSHQTGVIGTSGDDTDASTNTSGIGVYGYSNRSAGSVGVMGDSILGAGVVGAGADGVVGFGAWGVSGFGDVAGLWGTGRTGVQGDVPTTGTGVAGWVGQGDAPTPPAGVGVYAAAETTSQVALKVSGKVQLSRAGRTYVATNASYRTVTMAGVTTSSFIIATLQTRRTGVYVHAVVPAAGKFTIYLNKAVSANTYVGYVVIN
jgi:hypothetical protein